MVKKISVVAIAGLLCLPATALAAPSVEQLQQQIELLSQELNKLRTQMQEIKGNSEKAVAKVEDMKEQSEKWNDASRFELSGDFRSRIDFNTADTPSHYTALDIGRGVEWFTDPNTISPFAGNIDENSHTVTGSMGESYGTAGLLYGFMLQSIASNPMAPTPTEITTAASYAGPMIGNVVYGSQSAVTVTANTSNGQMTGVTINGTPAELSQSQKTQNLVSLMKQFTPAQRYSLFQSMGYTPDAANEYDNDTMWTNRLRINMKAKATENVVFKGRLAMYKAWGMQNNPIDYTFNNGLGGGPYMLSSLSFDGSSTRQPQDNVLRVDRAYVNWSDIGDTPVWFSIGRRPTTDGPPGQFRQGLDERAATPTAFMDYPFDGLTLGYAYENFLGIDDFPGKVRFCYGRGFESGPVDNSNTLKDVDFAGISWDVYDKGPRFLSLQSFVAFDMFNVPDNINFVNPIEFAVWEDDSSAYNPLDSSRDMTLNRKNLGNIIHTTGAYTDRVADNLDYFLALGWSRTDPNGYDEMGTGLLSSWWDANVNESKNGYSLYTGMRYKIPDSRVALGLEYNYGSKNWIGFTPGHDDMSQGKLSARGQVYEAYMTYRFPAGEKVSKYADFFMRLGYQHYKYKYTGSGFWLGEPLEIDSLANDPMAAQFYTPVEDLDQVYLSIDTYF